MRYWSLDASQRSRTVCDLGQSDMRDVYYHHGNVFECRKEKMDLATIPHTSEVKPSHPEEITDMVISGEGKEEMIVTSCTDGKIRIWK